MGVPISGPSYIYGDNASVMHNMLRPESALKKNSSWVWFNAVCESFAMDESLIRHIQSIMNVADLMTKVSYGQIQRYLVSDIYDDKWELDYWFTCQDQASLIPLVIVSILREL